MTLKLTKKELESFVNGYLPDRFEEIFNDIPMYHPDHVMEKGETHRDYQGRGGSEYRWFIFKDTLDGEEYLINYTYNVDWPNDIMDFPSSIELVDNKEESDIYVKPEPVIVPEKILTPEELADKKIVEEYNSIKDECQKVVPKQKLNIPMTEKPNEEVINEFIKRAKHFCINIQEISDLVGCNFYKDSLTFTGIRLLHFKQTEQLVERF